MSYFNIPNCKEPEGEATRLKHNIPHGDRVRVVEEPCVNAIRVHKAGISLILTLDCHHVLNTHNGYAPRAKVGRTHYSVSAWWQYYSYRL